MILLISAVFPPEPVVSALITYDLAIALSEDSAVNVLTPRPSRPYGFVFEHASNENRRFKQIILNSYTCPESKLFGRMRESYSFGRHAVEYIKKNRSEIKFIYLNGWPLFGQYLIIKAIKSFSIPSVVHVQDIYPESLSNKIPFFSSVIQAMLLPVDRYILKNSTKIIAISENMRKTFVQTRGIPEDKIEIVQNWQDENKFIEYYESRNLLEVAESIKKPFTFMYLGNIGPVAGVDFLIRSFAKANIKDALLIVAGTGSKKMECVEIAQSYRDIKIMFLDVPSQMVPEIQNQADVMLLPVKFGASLSSIPSKLPAYLYSRKPVIASIEEQSDTANAIMKAKCCWVMPPEDMDKLAETMKKVAVLSKDDLNNYGMNGYNYAIEHFSKKTNLQKMVKIINEVLQS